MPEPILTLLLTRLAAIDAELAADPGSAAAWAKAQQELEPVRATEPDLASCVDAKDAAAFHALVVAWSGGQRMLPEVDRALLKRALKAFKKRLKVTRLDDESSIGGGAMSSGRHSGLVAITPPREFAGEVWEELVKQGRLKRGGSSGIYEMPPNAALND